MIALTHFLRRLVKLGSLTVIDADGATHRFGPGDEADPSAVTMRISDRRLYLKLTVHPRLYLGEAYMDGTLSIERGDLWSLLELCGRNLADRHRARRGLSARLLNRIGQLLTQYNPSFRAQRNVAHHYDLSDALFDSFLDRDRQYSCAYFTSGAATLDEAQAAKKRHLAAKLRLRRDQNVLDIGCGWGGFALELARNHDVDVHGITLSKEQVRFAQDLARSTNLADRARFSLCDYRTVEGRYDRIVSVGMFEHVGTPHYRAFFGKLRDLLAADGIAVLHTIGRMDGPGVTSAWARKYIFPGSYVPALSEILPAIEEAGLWVTDIEVLRLHYAETLRHWRERFMSNWARLESTHDARFRRMWEFYLAAAEMDFRYGGLAVFQIQLAKGIGTVPVTRDYLYGTERVALEPSSSGAD